MLGKQLQKLKASLCRCLLLRLQRLSLLLERKDQGLLVGHGCRVGGKLGRQKRLEGQLCTVSSRLWCYIGLGQSLHRCGGG